MNLRRDGKSLTGLIAIDVTLHSCGVYQLKGGESSAASIVPG
jgi:hypothetical protein